MKGAKKFIATINSDHIMKKGPFGPFYFGFCRFGLIGHVGSGGLFRL